MPWFEPRPVVLMYVWVAHPARGTPTARPAIASRCLLAEIDGVRLAWILWVWVQAACRPVCSTGGRSSARSGFGLDSPDNPYAWAPPACPPQDVVAAGGQATPGPRGCQRGLCSSSKLFDATRLSRPVIPAACVFGRPIRASRVLHCGSTGVPRRKRKRRRESHRDARHCRAGGFNCWRFRRHPAVAERGQFAMLPPPSWQVVISWA